MTNKITLMLIIISFLIGYPIGLLFRPCIKENVFKGVDTYLEAKTQECIEQIEARGFRLEEKEEINYPFWTEYNTLNSLLITAERECIETIYYTRIGRTTLFWIMSKSHLGQINYKGYRVS